MSILTDGRALLDGAVWRLATPTPLTRYCREGDQPDVYGWAPSRMSCWWAHPAFRLHASPASSAPGGTHDMSQRTQCPIMYSISSVITGAGFDTVYIEGLCGCYQDETGRRLFTNPSLALKLGHSLHKCAQMKWGMALRKSDDAALKVADDFISLHSAEFTDTVSSAALASQRIRGNTQRNPFGRGPREAEVLLAEDDGQSRIRRWWQSQLMTLGERWLR